MRHTRPNTSCRLELGGGRELRSNQRQDRDEYSLVIDRLSEASSKQFKRITCNQVRRKSSQILFTVFVIILTTIVPILSVDCLQATNQQQQQQHDHKQQPISRRQESLTLNPFHHEAITSNLPSPTDWAQRLPGPNYFGPATSVSPQALTLANLIASHRTSSVPGIVANRGQRILRNIANKTTNALNDLAVARQILASDASLVQQQQQQQQQLQQQQANQQNENPRLFPTMNKLVNYLFPNNSTNQVAKVEEPLKLIASSTDLMSPSASGSSFSRASHLRPTVSEEPASPEKSVSLSLGAPYEPRPRPRQLLSSSSNGTESDSRWPDLRTSAQTNILYPDMGANEQNQEYANMVNDTSQLTADESNHQQESGDQNQFQQMANDTDFRFMGNEHSSGSNYIDQSDATNPNETSASDPSGSPEHQFSDSSENDSQVNEDGQQQQQQHQDESSVENTPANESEFDDVPSTMQHNPNMPNFTTENTMQELRSAQANFNPSQTATGGSLDDESLLAAQLPSQYDAVLRLPPDGYYDDYFKPANSDLVPQAPGMASLFQDATSEFTLAPNDEFHQHLANNRTESQESKYSTPGIDYTAQYYLNQQPLKQQPSPNGGDQNVEFIAANKSASSVPSDRKHKSIGDASLNSYQHETVDSARNTSGQVGDQGQRQIVIIGNLDGQGKRNISTSSPSSSSSSNHQLEDSIQVILANTNSARDPLSNEKLINYISEGQNITLAAGKPPRSTFVNRDMNEFPSVDNLASSNGTGNEPASSTEGPIGSRWNGSPSQHNNESVRDHQGQGNNEIDDDNNNARPTNQPNAEPESEDELLRATVDSTGYGRYKNGQRVDSETDEEPEPPNRQYRTDQRKSSNFIDRSAGRSMPANGNSNYHNNNNHHHHNNNRHHNKDKRFKSEQNSHGPTSRPPRNSNQNHGNHHGGNNRQRHYRHQQQQTIRRPQVSQVNFNPKDLIVHSPTPAPTVADTIVDLPAKAKKVHNDPPDKNELMNELLTALDRVKAAIYKLQPLTAKMNAIYRKSVTSNTRDIIMDHHKGTYAKRYPPGDYDDTYDRMHPNELISRGLSRASSPTSPRRERASPRDMEAASSMSTAVYLPAPAGLNTSSATSSQQVAAVDGLNLDESQLVATGIGRRLGDGRIVGQLSLTSGAKERIVYDDDDLELYSGSEYNLPAAASNRMNRTSSANATFLDSAAPNFVPPEQLAEVADGSSVQSPLFGYRITIFQSPDSDETDGVTLENGDNFAYELGAADSAALVTEVPGAAQDDMATSESSAVELSQLAPNGTLGDEETLSGSESKYKKKKMEMEKKKKKMEEGEHKKKGAKEKAEKKAEKSKKEVQKKKKNEEESKKKKEYKRIKHNKGVVTKEKKTMHRDKHIKAHDRGAAKEKALKERTQIEFFEREQIVDDEFEKAKKSTMKAGWQSGHEAKKSAKEMHGDTMSSGGSHYVKHAPYAEKGSGMASESSSAKESNKFEKKNMEAKGKKFKGWREKGYKIITETEFIDRGSLHDSAYKKRDKGAAHHQKYKKQESMSEGHHGSMQEHHKKMHQKEEKKHKQQEKKDEHMKKEAKEKKEVEKKKKEGGEKKKKKKMEKHGGDHELEESAATVEPIGDLQLIEGDPGHRQRSSGHLSLPSTTNFRPPAQFGQQQRPESLIRLLTANHDDGEQQVDILQRRDSPPLGGQTTNRTIDVSSATKSPQNKSQPTILDIIDNSTGNHVNKTKIGTYELDEQQPQQRARNLTSVVDNLVAKFLPSTKTASLVPKTPTTSAPRSLIEQSNQKQKSQQLGDDRTSSKPNSLASLMSRVDQALGRERQLLSDQQSKQQQPQKSRQDAGLAANGNTNNMSHNNHLSPPITYNDATDKAVQLLQLIQQADRMGEPTNQMHAQQADFSLKPPRHDHQLPFQQQQQALLQSAFLQQQLVAAAAAANPYGGQQNQLFAPPSGQFSFGPGGHGAFGPDQLLDYDQDSILAQAALLGE